VEILHEHEFSDSTLERWCRQLKERGPQIFASSDHSLLAERERQITGLERVIGQ
jgi:transposase-like protein